MSFVNHTSVVPMAVSSTNGEMKAFMEAPWTPLNTKSFKGTEVERAKVHREKFGP